MIEITDPVVAKRNAIMRGYSAFNEGDWDTLRGLLCSDVVWHTMPGEHGPPRIEGRDEVIAYLQKLRDTSEAEFLSVVIQDDVAITLDFTHTSRHEGDHACADEIEFDETGCIKEVRHCAAATHRHGHAGDPAAS